MIWADLARALIPRAEDAVGLACVRLDLHQRVTPTVVHWAAHANAALLEELRLADLPAGSTPDDPEPWDESPGPLRSEATLPEGVLRRRQENEERAEM